MCKPEAGKISRKIIESHISIKITFQKHHHVQIYTGFQAVSILEKYIAGNLVTNYHAIYLIQALLDVIEIKVSLRSL